MADEQNKQYSTPGYSPGDINPVGKEELLMEQVMLKIEKVAPAEIVSYDRNTNRASVQILNQAIYADGSKLTQKVLNDIPVFMMSGGGFIFSFPLKPKDKGWIIAADRDISIFKQLLSVFAPATYEKHRYKDGFFLPDKIKGFEITQDEDGAVILTSEDNNTKLVIKDGEIKLKAPSIILEGNTQVNGTLTATTINALNGVSGTFANSVTSTNGIVTGGG